MKPVVICNTYYLHLDPKQERRMEPYPPLGTLYAAAVLREKGYDIHFFDTIFCSGPEAIFNTLSKFQGGIFIICDDGFNYLTKMCLVNMREACFAMIKKAKEEGFTILVSSSDATDHWQDYLNVGADAIVIGEPEQTIAACVDALQHENPALNTIEGLGLRTTTGFAKTPARALMQDLDNLPLPAWDLIDMDQYRSRWMAHSGYFSINMTTTRGCPFKCNWCAKPIYGNRYHSRSAKAVADEINLLRNTYQVEHIWFCDDIFGLKPNWINNFAGLMQEQPIPFKIQCRADLLLDENNIQSLAGAGCDEVWIGAESGSQKILDAMDKGTTIAQITESSRLMYRSGIKPCFFLQFGYPGETLTDIKSTMQLLRNCKPYDIGISISYPLPGTVFYDRVFAQLSNKQNWNDSDELLMMYHGTYSAAFYKYLHRYVHRRFRMLQGMKCIREIFSGKRNTTSPPLKRLFALPIHSVLCLYYFLMVQTKKQPVSELQVAS